MHEPLPAYSCVRNFPDLLRKEQEQKLSLFVYVVTILSFPDTLFLNLGSKVGILSDLDIDIVEK